MAPKRKRQEAEELGSEEEEEAEAEEVISSDEDQASDGEEEEEEEVLEPKILPNRTTRGGRMKVNLLQFHSILLHLSNLLSWEDIQNSLLILFCWR